MFESLPEHFLNPRCLALVPTFPLEKVLHALLNHLDKAVNTFHTTNALNLVGAYGVRCFLIDVWQSAHF